jgi:CRISPR/Cas system-associated exonuclease Cas4 (RecB family)
MTIEAPDRPAWSKSQVAALRECRRKLVFIRKASEETRDKRLANIPSLKKVRNRHLWSGSLVHETIGDVLKLVRQGEPVPDEDAVIDKLRERMRAEFKASKEGKAESSLFEHKFNTPVAPEAWKKQWEAVERSVRWFMKSNWLRRLAALGPECWKAVDEVLAFDVNGVKAYAKIDCGVETDGKFFLIDWRTSPAGPREEPALQVAALYAHENWGAEPDAIQALAVSLQDGSTYHANVNEESLMETHLRIEEESGQLEEAAVAGDPFAISPPSDIQICRRCSFQSVCYPTGLGE